MLDNWIRGQLRCRQCGMPYTLSWEPRGVYRKYFGDVSIAERAHSLERICADPRFDDLCYTITCYLDVQRYEATPDDTRGVAALHIGPLATNPRIILAAVATRPDILSYIEAFKATGFVRRPYGVFDTLPEARAWIERTHPCFLAGRWQGP
jgi:hypothetical protein